MASTLHRGRLCLARRFLFNRVRDIPAPRSLHPVGRLTCASAILANSRVSKVFEQMKIIGPNREIPHSSFHIVIDTP